MNYETRLLHNTKNVPMETRGERTCIFPIILKRIRTKEKGQLHTPSALTLGEKFDVNVTVHRRCIRSSITNKMQRYTIFFIAVNAVHVSGGFSAHHCQLTYASDSSKQA